MFNSVNQPNLNNLIVEIDNNNMLGIEHESYTSKTGHIHYLYRTFPHFSSKPVKFRDSGYKVN